MSRKFGFSKAPTDGTAGLKHIFWLVAGWPCQRTRALAGRLFLRHCFIGGAAEAAEHESTLEIWDQMDGEGREEAAANE